MTVTLTLNLDEKELKELIATAAMERASETGMVGTLKSVHFAYDEERGEVSCTIDVELKLLKDSP